VESKAYVHLEQPRLRRTTNSELGMCEKYLDFLGSPPILNKTYTSPIAPISQDTLPEFVSRSRFRFDCQSFGLRLS
jgi:hypothetical protein